MGKTNDMKIIGDAYAYAETLGLQRLDDVSGTTPPTRVYLTSGKTGLSTEIDIHALRSLGICAAVDHAYRRMVSA